MEKGAKAQRRKASKETETRDRGSGVRKKKIVGSEL